MNIEGNKTTLMRRDPASGGFLIRAGNTITLAEMLFAFLRMLFCFDILPTWIFQRLPCQSEEDKPVPGRCLRSATPQPQCLFRDVLTE